MKARTGTWPECETCDRQLPASVRYGLYYDPARGTMSGVRADAYELERLGWIVLADGCAICPACDNLNRDVEREAIRKRREQFAIEIWREASEQNRATKSLRSNHLGATETV